MSIILAGDKNKFTKYGNIQVTDQGVVTGFLSGESHVVENVNFLQLKKVFNHNGKSWEMFFHVITPTQAKTVTEHCIIQQNEVGFGGIYLSYFNDTKNYRLAYATNDESTWHVLGTTSVIDYGTEVYLRVSYTLINTTTGYWKLEHSFDKNTWVEDCNVSAPVMKTQTNPFNIGSNDYHNCCFDYGTIFLSDFYIKLEGKIFYEGFPLRIKKVFYKPVHSDYKMTSGITNNNGVVSGFSPTECVSLDKIMPYITKGEWEVQIKFKETQEIDRIIGHCLAYDGAASDIPQGMVFGLTDSKPSLWISTDNTSWNIAHDLQATNIISMNKWYWVKIGWNKSEYYVLLSDDGKLFSKIISATSTTPINPTQDWQIGSYKGDIYFCHGEVDLNDTYFTANGAVWFDKYKYEIKEIFDDQRTILFANHEIIYTHFAQTFTSNTTINIPSTARNIQCWLVGGGGGGPSTYVYYIWGGSGGGAGGYSYNNYDNSLAGTTQEIIIGSGGGVNVSGGTSHFALQYAYGGAYGGNTGGPGGAGGGASGGSDNRQGAPGGQGAVLADANGGAGWTIDGYYCGNGGRGQGSGASGCCRIEYDYF